MLTESLRSWKQTSQRSSPCSQIRWTRLQSARLGSFTRCVTNRQRRQKTCWIKMSFGQWASQANSAASSCSSTWRKRRVSKSKADSVQTPATAATRLKLQKAVS